MTLDLDINGQHPLAAESDFFFRIKKMQFCRPKLQARPGAARKDPSTVSSPLQPPGKVRLFSSTAQRQGRIIEDQTTETLQEIELWLSPKFFFKMN